MTTPDFITELFCRVDDAMNTQNIHPQATKHTLAHLHPSEVVTLGLLLALSGKGNRAFDRWAQRDLKPLFPLLPERTRLFRLLEQHAFWTQLFLAQPTFFGVCDSYGIELVHPKREGRSPQQIGRKGKSNHRWIIGAKFAVLLNSHGLIVNWSCATANVHDSAFHPLIAWFQEQMIVLTDSGFHRKEGDPLNLKVCRKGSWSERMLIETMFSLLTGACRLKKLAHRAWQTLQMRLAYVVAAYNLCVQWHGEVRLSLAPFSL
jgi:hypothetical protein